MEEMKFPAKDADHHAAHEQSEHSQKPEHQNPQEGEMVDSHIEQHPVRRRQCYDARTDGDDQQQKVQGAVVFKDLDAGHHGHNVDQAHRQKLPESLVGVLGIAHPVGKALAQEQEYDLDAGKKDIDESKDRCKCNPGQGIGRVFLFFYGFFQVLLEQCGKKYIEQKESCPKAEKQSDAGADVRDRKEFYKISCKNLIRCDQKRHYA